MAHPYQNHRQNQVEKRRVKVLMKSGGYAGGGSACQSASGKTSKIANGYADGGKVQGEAAPARLDKRARGGGIHQITPSKRKPHLNVNIVNVNHRPKRSPALPGPAAGAGLPALPALPAPPPPMGAGLPMRARGGSLTKPNKLWGGGPYGGASEGMARLKMAKRKPMK